MKKLVVLTFLLAFVTVAFAGNGKGEVAKAVNYKQVLKEIQYPQVCREKGIEGKVIVMLKIDKHGNIKNYKFKEYPCTDLKIAVEAVLPSMVFEPARNESGEAVAGKIALPVNFQLSI